MLVRWGMVEAVMRVILLPCRTAVIQHPQGWSERVAESGLPQLMGGRVPSAGEAFMMRHSIPRSAAIATLLLILAGSARPGAQPSPVWPQWRGPSGQGISTDTSLPLEWSADTHVLWKAAIPGRGYSSPSVWNDHVFLTTY